jgi:hypothetical protein
VETDMRKDALLLALLISALLIWLVSPPPLHAG